MEFSLEEPATESLVAVVVTAETVEVDIKRVGGGYTEEDAVNLKYKTEITDSVRKALVLLSLRIVL